MVTIISLANEVYLYVFLTLLFIFFLVKYKQKIDNKNIINYIIYLTNKIILFILFVVFLFASFLTITEVDKNIIISFIKENVRGLIYYSFFNYIILYGIKLIHFFKEFFKKNDIFGISYISKGGFKK